MWTIAASTGRSSASGQRRAYSTPHQATSRPDRRASRPAAAMRRAPRRARPRGPGGPGRASRRPAGASAGRAPRRRSRRTGRACDGSSHRSGDGHAEPDRGRRCRQAGSQGRDLSPGHRTGGHGDRRPGVRRRHGRLRPPGASACPDGGPDGRPARRGRRRGGRGAGSVRQGVRRAGQAASRRAVPPVVPADRRERDPQPAPRPPAGARPGSGAPGSGPSRCCSPGRTTRQTPCSPRSVRPGSCAGWPALRDRTARW